MLSRALAYNTKEDFVREIRIMVTTWSHAGTPSGECRRFMRLFMNVWQQNYPKTYQDAYYTPEHFQGVMNVLQDPMSCLDSLQTIHDIVFPLQEQDFMLYYTSEQMEALTEVLLPLAHRIVYLREPVVEVVAPVAEGPAPVPTVLPMIIEEEIVQKLAFSAIDMITQDTDESLMRGEMLDSGSVLAHARNLGNLVDMRASFRGMPDVAPDFGFFPTPDDVQFDHDLERALAASMRDSY